MILKQKNIIKSHSLHIGFYVHEKRKEKSTISSMTLIKHYGDNVSLIYSNTDLLLLEFKDVAAIETELLKSHFVEYTDFWNYPKEHPLYNESRKGQLGLLKSETANDYSSKIICIQQKYYSILLNSDSTKQQHILYSCTSMPASNNSFSKLPE